MAQINETCYENMMAALYAFASKIYTKSSEMQTLAYECTNALGEDDSGAKEAYKKIALCQQKYAEAAQEAKNIAAALQEELDNQKKEKEIWTEE